MKTKISYKDKNFKKDLDGIDFLRGLVNCCNARNENYNDNKTPNQLIKDYYNYLNNDKNYDFFNDCKAIDY